MNVENRDIAEIQFAIDEDKNGKKLNGIEMLPIIVTMAIMDNNKYFIIDPLYEEELCCDVIIRIAVYSNGNISIIKNGDKPIDPLLIFNMIDNGKECGLKWMKELDQYLKASLIDMNDKMEKKENKEDKDELDLFDLSNFEFNEEDEKQIEMEMSKQLGIEFYHGISSERTDSYVYSHENNQNVSAEMIENKQNDNDIDVISKSLLMWVNCKN